MPYKDIFMDCPRHSGYKNIFTYFFLLFSTGIFTYFSILIIFKSPRAWGHMPGLPLQGPMLVSNVQLTLNIFDGIIIAIHIVLVTSV